MTYDPEIPRGFQDADIEQAELEAAGAHLHALRRQGICTHGWRLSNWHKLTPEQVATSRARGHFPERPTAPAPIPAGHDLCLDCGQHVREWVSAR